MCFCQSDLIFYNNHIEWFINIDLMSVESTKHIHLSIHAFEYAHDTSKCHDCNDMIINLRTVDRRIRMHWGLITGFVRRVTRWVQHFEKELLNLLEHMRSHLVFSGIHVVRSLGVCVMFCRSFLSFLVHLDQRSRWTIAITWRSSSVNFSHFKLLLRNHWANWNQT